jgi:hypothetical protein
MTIKSAIKDDNEQSECRTSQIVRAQRVTHKMKSHFLKSICPSRLVICKGNVVHSLSAGQLYEILQFQAGKSYDKNWLKIKKECAYFMGSNGLENSKTFHMDIRVLLLES